MKYRIKKYGQKGIAKTNNKLIAFGTTKITPYYMKQRRVKKFRKKKEPKPLIFH